MSFSSLMDTTIKADDVWPWIKSQCTLTFATLCHLDQHAYTQHWLDVSMFFLTFINCLFFPLAVNWSIHCMNCAKSFFFMMGKSNSSIMLCDQAVSYWRRKQHFSVHLHSRVASSLHIIKSLHISDLPIDILLMITNTVLISWSLWVK